MTWVNSCAVAAAVAAIVARPSRPHCPARPAPLAQSAQNQKIKSRFAGILALPRVPDCADGFVSSCWYVLLCFRAKYFDETNM
jgi:hypothetical protein